MLNRAENFHKKEFVGWIFCLQGGKRASDGGFYVTLKSENQIKISPVNIHELYNYSCEKVVKFSVLRSRNGRF